MKNNSKKHDDTKSRLINAAGEVFAQHGFRSATVREICSRADAHLGAMNYHFRDKVGLYVAVLEHSHQLAAKKHPLESGLRNGATPEEKLRAFIRSFLLRLLGEGFPAWHGKLMAREIADPTDALNQVIQSSVRPLYSYMVGILYELLGEAKPAEGEESEEIFLSIMGIVGQCLHHFTGKRVVAAIRPKSFDPADIERIADHIARFSLAGIRELKSTQISRKGTHESGL
jgi:AcrR family transcriptional regulator